MGYRFLDQEWSLPDDWGPVRSASARVERTFVPLGSRFVVTGRLEPADGEPVLMVSEQSDGSVYAGSLEDMRASSERIGSVLRFAWLPLLACSLLMLVRVRRIRRDFVRRSNEG